ncbi:MAG: tetratricopeptide repeat protein [Bacteroidota bacterium]
MKKIVFIFCLLAYATAIYPQVFNWNANCTRAYHDAISLKIAKAQSALTIERQTNPQNLVPDLIENYIDFFVLFLNEDPKERKARIGQWQKRLDRIDQAPSSSPFKLFSKAIINMQWAVVEIKFGNRWAAGWAFRDAFKLAKENQEKFPAFTPNLMITGPMQMAAATIPKNYRWLSNLLGIKGTMEQGRKHMKNFTSSQDPWALLFAEEGIFYQCYLQFYLLNQPDEALQSITSRKLDVVNNHLFTYMAANLYLNNKQSNQCKAIVSGRNRSNEYLQTGVWDFEMAFAKLYHLEPDANIYFERFLASFKGNFYVKDAWLKLAMHYLVQDNRDQYNKCIANAISKGSTLNDADKRALKEAKSGRLPNLFLLKSRLLNDGGYHREALNVVAGKTSNDFDRDEDKLEFMYRVGRIYDDLGKEEEALNAYKATINFGKNRTEYFAARAALQTGLIYEKLGNTSKAILFYQQCLDMDDHDFKDSLDQKAKAGLSRCKGR